VKRQTGNRGPKTEDRAKSVIRHPSSVSGLRSLVCDTEGQALLETVIAFPVLLLFILVVMELSMLYNGKQLANYAAFCAARTAAVHGTDDTTRTHLAAAMAMSSIASSFSNDPNGILAAFDVPKPDTIVAVLCSIPGFQGDTAQWIRRLANAYVRTGQPTCVVGAVAGKRRHVEVDVTYIYRCNFVPFGFLWGTSGVTAYYNSLPPGVKTIVSGFQEYWNIRIRGHAVTDYWGG
jgi:hypothetical protein